MFYSRLIERVRETIRRYRMLQPGDRVLVAVSGGPDSMALLCVLAQLQKEIGLVLAVSHFDHRMRADSGLDLAFVRQSAARFSFPFFSGSKDVPDLVRRSGGNLEEVARLQRRAFLERIAEEENFGKIATGHTMDDQAETVLMNLLRGSGPAGLGGIAPRHGKWIRPLIQTIRVEVLDFLKEEEVSFRLDSTNLDVRFLRNRVRQRLVPLLQKDYSVNIVERLAALAEIERETARFWTRSCRRWVQSDSVGPFLRVKDLCRRSVAEQREAIRLFIFRVRGNLRRITFEQTESVRDLIHKEASGKKAVLPGGWEVSNVRGVLRAVRKQ